MSDPIKIRITDNGFPPIPQPPKLPKQSDDDLKKHSIKNQTPKDPGFFRPADNAWDETTQKIAEKSAIRFDNIDIDKNRSLSLKEYSEGCIFDTKSTNGKSNSKQDELIDKFSNYDFDKDGHLSAKEFIHMDLDSLRPGEKPQPPNKNQIEPVEYGVDFYNKVLNPED